MKQQLVKEGNKWVCENYSKRNDLVITPESIKETVYIFGCVDCVIQLKAKCNSIMLDKCTGTSVVIDSVVSSFEIVNSKKTKIQVVHSAPVITADNCDSLQIYLSKTSLSSEIFTCKSTTVNVLIPGETEEDDMIERNIAEQFKTVIQGTKLVSVAVEHKG